MENTELSSQTLCEQWRHHNKKKGGRKQTRRINKHTETHQISRFSPALFVKTPFMAVFEILGPH